VPVFVGVSCFCVCTEVFENKKGYVNDAGAHTQSAGSYRYGHPNPNPMHHPDPNLNPTKTY